MSSGVFAQIKSTPVPTGLRDGLASRILDRTMPVAGLTRKKRVAFIQRTYAHFLAALAVFALLELLFFQLGAAATVGEWNGPAAWFAMLSALVVVAWLASRVAHRVTTLRAQYTALAVFIIIEALVFLPVLQVALTKSAGTLRYALLLGALALTGLSAVVFLTRKDFSFLRGLLCWTALVVIGLVTAGTLDDLHSSAYLSASVIGIAGAAILHDTSRILHRFSEDRYVAAGLELFASVGMLFWLVMRLFVSRD